MLNDYYIYMRWEKLSNKIQNDIIYSDNRYRIEVLSFELFNRVYLSDNNKGEKSIYIEFSVDEVKNYTPIQINGLDIKIFKNEQLSSEKLYLKIALLDMFIEEAFLAFTSSIIINIQNSKSSLETIETIEKITKKYTDFFSKKALKSLTNIKEQGLFAELSELSSQIDQQGEDSVISWEGPEKRRRDFVFSNYEIEVKSTVVINDMTVTITSESQLEPSISPLFLHVYVLEKTTSGLSILNLIDDILIKINSIQTKKMFIGKLFLLGIDKNEYIINSQYRVVRAMKYIIDDSFPRIKKQFIPSEVFEINYKLDLKSVKGEIIQHA